MHVNAAFWRGLGAVAAVVVLLTFGDASAQTGKKTSLCKGLDEKGCRTKAAECSWITPKKGKQRPYCRMRPARKSKS